MENDSADGHENEAISWHVEVAVKAGELEQFRTLTLEMVNVARGEPGVLIYERYIDGGGKHVHIYERYSNSLAALAHLKTFNERFASQYSELVERKVFTVFGAPSEELRRMLKKLAASFCEDFAGFSRCS